MAVDLCRYSFHLRVEMEGAQALPFEDTKTVAVGTSPMPVLLTLVLVCHGVCDDLAHVWDLLFPGQWCHGWRRSGREGDAVD